MNLIKLVEVLERKTEEGIKRLEGTEISSSTYERVLNNVIAGISIIDKLSYKPEPKQKPKNEKEN